jgi:putative oxidoreductase
MHTSDIVTANTMSAGLLLFRVVLGLYMAAHGAQKLFGWFRGHGLAAAAGMFEQIGFRPGHVFVRMAAGSEVASGVLVALGLLGPVGPALMVSVMIVAIGSVHRPYGFFATNNGVEVPLLYAAGAFALALTGFGMFSLDAALGLTWLWAPRLVWGALGLGIAGGLMSLAMRRTAKATAEATV